MEDLRKNGPRHKMAQSRLETLQPPALCMTHGCAHRNEKVTWEGRASFLRGAKRAMCAASRCNARANTPPQPGGELRHSRYRRDPRIAADAKDDEFAWRSRPPWREEICGALEKQKQRNGHVCDFGDASSKRLPIFRGISAPATANAGGTYARAGYIRRREGMTQIAQES